MSNKKQESREAREALERFKMENADELGIDASQDSERERDLSKEEDTKDKKNQ